MYRGGRRLTICCAAAMTPLDFIVFSLRGGFRAATCGIIRFHYCGTVCLQQKFDCAVGTVLRRIGGESSGSIVGAGWGGDISSKVRLCDAFHAAANAIAARSAWHCMVYVVPGFGVINCKGFSRRPPTCDCRFAAQPVFEFQTSTLNFSNVFQLSLCSPSAAHRSRGQRRRRLMCLKTRQNCSGILNVNAERRCIRFHQVRRMGLLELAALRLD